MQARIYVGNLNPRVSERELEEEFTKFGYLRNVWVARNPPGFAFIDFDDHRDAEDAVRRMDGSHGWRVEFSRKDGSGSGRRGSRGGGGSFGGSRGRDSSLIRCYECGEVGHLARDCRIRRARTKGYRRSRSRSRSRGRSYSRDVSRSRSRSYRSRSRSRSRSGSRGRDRSRSPRRSLSRGRSPTPDRKSVSPGRSPKPAGSPVAANGSGMDRSASPPRD